MPRKILKYEYKLQGTDLCNPRKCWDERKTLDIQVGECVCVCVCVCVYVCVCDLLTATSSIRRKVNFQMSKAGLN